MISGVLFAVATAVLWSLIPFGVRFVVGALDPVTISVSRLFIGGLLFAAIARGRAPLFRLLRNRPTRPWILYGAAGLALNHIFFTAGLQWTSPAAGVIAVQIQTVAAAVLSAVILGETMSLRKSAAIAVVIAGIVLVGWDGQNLSEILGSGRFLGNLSMYAGGLSWGVYAVCQRGLSVRPAVGKPPVVRYQAVARHDPRDLLAPFFLLAGILSLPLVPPFFDVRETLTPAVVAVLAVLATMGTVSGYYCFSAAINRLPVATAATITSTSPLGVALISILVFGESISLYTIIGGVMAVAGCAAAVHADVEKPRAEPDGAKPGASVR